MNQKPELERIKDAWKNLPSGAKNILYNEKGHTQQNVDDILKKGRKDKEKLVKLLIDMKDASYIVRKQVVSQDDTVQNV